MAYIYKNITGNTAQLLLSKDELKYNNIKNMNICNIHASDKVSVDLYLYRTSIDTSIQAVHHDFENSTTSSNTYYLFKNVELPYRVPLQLESSDLLLDYKTTLYDLYIKLNAVDSAVDVIINNKT